MPCYTAWNEIYQPGTPEHARVEAELRAKLTTIKHIVDYYYEAKQMPKPVIAAGTAIDPFRQPKSRTESSVREAICHHFGCDGVGVTTLYDVCTFLDERVEEDNAYLAVILPCVSLLRKHPEKFKTTYA